MAFNKIIIIIFINSWLPFPSSPPTPLSIRIKYTYSGQWMSLPHPFIGALLWIVPMRPCGGGSQQHTGRYIDFGCSTHQEEETSFWRPPVKLPFNCRAVGLYKRCHDAHIEWSWLRLQPSGYSTCYTNKCDMAMITPRLVRVYLFARLFSADGRHLGISPSSSKISANFDSPFMICISISIPSSTRH